ncbi:hypothetical protein VN97_g849 [Penicillium thymicola]|uniref:Uncharacterized protein n=1 Tax=Penicillium thymicola TaxID=293382 RepID=A0AAI9TTB0_PENTH|nr:hypothetical protein VN97_g849 [Penicillium thymicola]
MATPRQNPVIGAIFLAWGPDGREREREKPYVDQVYLAPPVEPAQTLFLFFSVFLFLFFFFLFFISGTLAAWNVGVVVQRIPSGREAFQPGITFRLNGVIVYTMSFPSLKLTKFQS